MRNEGATTGSPVKMVLLLLGVVISSSNAAGGSELSFRYEDGSSAETAAAGLRMHEADVSGITGRVYVYATFGMLGKNPIGDDAPQGMQTVVLGEMVRRRFTPAIRFGLADDGRGLKKAFRTETLDGLGRVVQTAESEAHLVPWASDGRLDYFGPHVRVQTPYDFKLILDTERGRASVFVACRGDDRWFLLADDVAFEGDVAAINHIRVEQYPGAAGIEDVAIVREPVADREAIRPHPLAKRDRTVGPDRGFVFQSTRSLCWQPERHVTIARDPARWLGFPDVVQTSSGSLICTYVDGAGHGGGGGVFVRHSHDQGKTWGEPTCVHPGGANSPRIQKLRDGALLLLCDIGEVNTVFYDSTDDGKTWTNQRWCRPSVAGGHKTCVPSRVAELPDGSWLIGGAWYPEGGPFGGLQGQQIEFFRSTDRGDSWKFHALLADWPPRSLCEPSILVLDDGRLLLYARDARSDGFPGIKALSDDMGKTWKVSELPFAVNGRTCAGFLKDGRVMLTFRENVGQNGLWAWVGDPFDDTSYRAVGVHLNDLESVGLRDGCLHIDNDGRRGQFTQYHLRTYDSPESKIDVTVEVKVVANEGRAATLSVPFVGRFQLFPDRVELAHDRSLRVDVREDEFHAYRVVRDGKRFQLYVDGRMMIESEKADVSTVTKAWTPTSRSLYTLAFGNDNGGGVSIHNNTNVNPIDVDPTVTGYSIWRRAEVVLEDPVTGNRAVSWLAARDRFPDQYLLDHVVEVEASVSGGDQGYSGWTELDDGRVVVVNYTDDLLPRWRMAGKMTIGGSWIRGTYLLPEDLPPQD